MNRYSIAGVCVTACLTVAHAEPPVNVEPTQRPRAEELAARSWWEIVEAEVPAMRNELGDRWPMVMWYGPGSAPLEPRQVELLLERGLTQHLRLDSTLIPSARALQAAGSKVIMMQGPPRWYPFPYSLAPDSADWSHDFDDGFRYEDAGPGPLGQWHGACPLMHAGWAVLADDVRRILGAYRDAGVTVDGLWLDWEGDPYPFSNLFGQLAHCRRCRRQLPPAVLTDRGAWWEFSWRAYVQLHGAYVAAPAREVFPELAVTNWFVVFSSRRDPLYYFVDDRVLPPLAPPMFTATNPVAYGNDAWYRREWQEEWPADRRHVDQFYMHNLLRGVSVDAVNRAAYGPTVRSFPWVARYCALLGDPEGVIPDMSRPAYREALRHLWLRDIDGMQLFNPRTDGFEELWILELQDAVAVYDEILAHRDLLANSEAMNLVVPGRQDDGVLWSGLRDADHAVVRVVSQGPEDGTVDVEAWEGVTVQLQAPTAGLTYRIDRAGPAVRAVD